MSSSVETTEKKALSINLDKEIYGTFAEIGAGQEVARQFFQAGLASQTVAKTMSAYDMKISDEIYGKSARYVCQDRILKMLDHEYDLLVDRLGPQRGTKSKFFAFADTVATQNRKRGPTKSHGWMGLRFQSKPNGPTNEVVLHVRLWDSLRLQQQEALAMLGVNLIHAAFFHTKSQEKFISHLMDNLSSRRVEVDMIRFQGLAFKHFDNRIASLELVRQGHTEAVMFDTQGKVQLLSDHCYGHSLLVARGTFRPMTNINLQVIEKGLGQLKADHPEEKKPKVFLEMTMNQFANKGDEIDTEDFLQRVDTISAMGYNVLISNFDLFHEAKNYLRTCTQNTIAMVVGAGLLKKIFDEKFYENLEGGILEAFSRLFDNHSKVLVFPYKTDTQCVTAQTYSPEGALASLYKYFLETQKITDISNCDDVDTSVHSKDVRQMLIDHDSGWEELVPEKIRDLIKEKKFFGY